MRTQLVLTVVGDDRSGLVQALADVVDQHGGNWEESRLGELAGTFAGVVVVSVPQERAEDLRAALEPLAGLLEVSVRPGGTPVDEGGGPGRPVLVEIMGNDQPGIVRSISTVLADHGLNVAEMETRTVEAPMAGGQLFEATVVATVLPEGTDADALQADLERLAGEIQVEVTFRGTEDLADG